jgi:hypothetical protein
MVAAAQEGSDVLLVTGLSLAERATVDETGCS